MYYHYWHCYTSHSCTKYSVLFRVIFLPYVPTSLALLYTSQLFQILSLVQFTLYLMYYHYWHCYTPHSCTKYSILFTSCTMIIGTVKCTPHSCTKYSVLFRVFFLPYVPTSLALLYTSQLYQILSSVQLSF